MSFFYGTVLVVHVIEQHNISNVVHHEHLAKKTAVVGNIYIGRKIEHFSCDGVLSISRWLGSNFTLNKILY